MSTRNCIMWGKLLLLEAGFSILNKWSLFFYFAMVFLYCQRCSQDFEPVVKVDQLVIEMIQMTKRINHSSEFKAKVVLEAIRKEMTMSESSNKYSVHLTQIGAWKCAATENLSTAFTRRGSIPEQVSIVDVHKLHSKIGQLVVERNFWPPLVHESMHCRAVDGLDQLLGLRGKIVSKDHRLSVRRQYKLLTLARSHSYYEQKGG